jgi:glutamate-1-semialdehyde aminotransferase
VKAQTRSLAESERLLAKARRIIPAQAQTLSKNATQWARGAAPLYVQRGEGAHVWDVDGNRYVDFPMALGPIILGHAWPSVNEAIERQLRDGVTFTLPHPLEIELAERLLAQIPGAERIRFGKTGSDANSAAIRIARAVTGRDGVLVGGYHGWHDWHIASTTRDLGVPAAVKALTATFDAGDLASLDAALASQAGGTAAVIIEPSGVTEPDPAHLQALVDRVRAAGALVIFDEIITGFRLGPGGAQERYGVVADLATFGKALGNGLPISAVTGRAEYMNRLDEIFFSGTHFGEVLAMAAAWATLDALTPEAYAIMEDRGRHLWAGVQRAIDDAGVGEWVSIDGAPQRTVVLITEPQPSDRGLLARTLVQQEMAERGVLFNGNNFICLAHSEEDLEQATDAYAAAFALLAEGIASGDVEGLLTSEPVQPAFRPPK